jgi:nicotinate-nucleotide adenylyltransferase
MSKATEARLQTAFAPSSARRIDPFRIAFFGGSFDPPHNGHLQIASAVADRFELNEIWFEPAGLQPLKDPSSLSSYEDRFEMTRLACATDPVYASRFVAHRHDAPRRDGLPNYTVDALIALNNSLALSHNDALFCIVGIDAFRGLDRWHRPVRLLGQAHWIICSRPGSTLSIDEVERVLPPCNITPISDFDLAAFDCAGEKFSTRLYLFDHVHVDISSTHIREGIRAGGSTRAEAESMLPPSVVAYIHDHNLYQ